MLTKGDNNHVDDLELYQGLDFLDRRHIIGKVRGYVVLHNRFVAVFHFFPLLGSCRTSDT